VRIDISLLLDCNAFFQIRSEEMHRVAEFGVAAHWDYKLQNKLIPPLPGKPSPSGSSLELPLLSEINLKDKTRMNSPSRVTQKGRIASYIEALTTSRESIMQNNLFVFLSSTNRAIDGKIVGIDPSATQVAEVLKKLGATIDGKMINAITVGTLKIFRNGLSTSLDEELHNGDVLTLPSIILNNLHI
jgi:hypothetical protein